LSQLGYLDKAMKKFFETEIVVFKQQMGHIDQSSFVTG
jgi:hypothetical protein